MEHEKGEKGGELGKGVGWGWEEGCHRHFHLDRVRHLGRPGHRWGRHRGCHLECHQLVEQGLGGMELSK